MKTIHALAVGDATVWEEMRQLFPPGIHLYGPHDSAGELTIYLTRAAVNATLPDVMLVDSSAIAILEDPGFLEMYERFAIPVVIFCHDADGVDPGEYMAISVPLSARNLRFALEAAIRQRRLKEENRLLRESELKLERPPGSRLERRVFGEQYKEAKRLYRLMFATIQQTREGVALVNPVGIIEYINSSFEEITGMKRRQLIGRHMKKCGGGRFASSLLLGVRKAVISHNPWHGKIKIGDRLFDLYVGEIRDSARVLVGYAGIFFDITVKTEMEQRMIQAQKMEALGTFAGGIAHDFNNIIQAIQTNVEAIHELSGEPELAQKFTNRVLRACERADSLVKKFLNFSRSRRSDPVPVQIEAIVREALDLLEATVPNHTAITLHSADALHEAMASSDGVYEIILNLVRNSIDAFNGRPGQIDIRLENEQLPPSNKLTLPAGNYVKMTVADTGSGISDEVAGRIFEPFFSTKQNVYGRGLGLAVVHGIVNSFHGHIGLKSTPGHGTEFYIYLPAHEDLPVSDGLNEHILLIGENRKSMEELRQIIAVTGCRITSAYSAEDALHLFAGEPLRFDMVISEKISHDRRHHGVFETIFDLRETIPAIFIADYSTLIDLNVGALNRVVLLMRPFAPEVLAQAVRALFRYRIASVGNHQERSADKEISASANDRSRE